MSPVRGASAIVSIAMMNRIKSWFDKSARRDEKGGKVQKSITAKPHVKEVRKIADRALKTYDKTFKDLARYDRGEITLRPVSR